MTQTIVCMKWGTRYPADFANRLWSMIKRVDSAVYNSVEQFLNGTLKPGEVRFDLKSGGIDFATDGGQMDAFKSKIDAYKQQIIDGTITVPATP